MNNPIFTEAMIEAGAKEYMAAWPNLDSDDKRNSCIRAIFLAMSQASGPTPVTELVERAWREGWKACRDSLTEDEAFCLTDDVEADAWADSKARVEAADTLTQQAREIEALREALESMVAEKIDYMTINHLGDPKKQHTIRQARAALSPTVATDSGAETRSHASHGADKSSPPIGFDRG